jgi:hypothetical protein
VNKSSISAPAVSELAAPELIDWGAINESFKTDGARVQYEGLTRQLGLFAWLAISAPHWNWYRFPAAFTIGAGLDQVIGWLLGGFLIAWLIQRAEKKAAV